MAMLVMLMLKMMMLTMMAMVDPEECKCIHIKTFNQQMSLFSYSISEIVMETVCFGALGWGVAFETVCPGALGWGVACFLSGLGRFLRLLLLVLLSV